MTRFLALLSLLPFVVALMGTAASALTPDFALHRHNVGRHAGMSRQVEARDDNGRRTANMKHIMFQMIKMEQRYGNQSNAHMHQKHIDIAAKWQLSSDALKRNMPLLAQLAGDIMPESEDSDASSGAASKTKTSDKAQSASASSTATEGGAGASTSSSTSSTTASTKNANSPKYATIPLHVELNDNGEQVEPNANFQFGGQKVLMTVDSGSTLPWIKAASYPAESKAHPMTGHTFKLQYGIGSVTGDLYRDDVTFGSLETQKLVVGMANKTSHNFEEDKAAGVMGLAFKELNHDKNGKKRATFLDQTFAQNTGLHSKEVCIAIQHAKGQSEMRFGGPRASLQKGQMDYYGLSKVGYWQIPIKSLAANGGGGISSMDAIIDTGTSIIPAGQDGAKAFYADVKGAKLDEDNGVYMFDCDAKIGAVLTMKDGKQLPLSDDDVNLGTLIPNSKKCVGAVMPLDTQGVIVLGLTALRNMYVCLDHGAERVGLASPAW